MKKANSRGVRTLVRLKRGDPLARAWFASASAKKIDCFLLRDQRVAAPPPRTDKTDKNDFKPPQTDSVSSVSDPPRGI
jgi:hypothetical protein